MALFSSKNSAIRSFTPQRSYFCSRGNEQSAFSPGKRTYGGRSSQFWSKGSDAQDSLRGYLTRKTGEEAREWSVEGRGKSWVRLLWEKPSTAWSTCDRGSPRAWTELQSHPPNPDAQDPASHTLLSVSHCLRAPQPGGLSQFPQQVYLRNSLLGTEVFKLLTFWPRLRHEGTFSCTSSSGVALRILVLSKWDLVPWRGIEPGRPALGVKSLNHWTTREGKKP